MMGYPAVPALRRLGGEDLGTELKLPRRVGRDHLSTLAIWQLSFFTCANRSNLVTTQIRKAIFVN